MPCYSCAIYFDDLDADSSPRGIDAVLANCAADSDAGYRAFKLKIGRGHRWMDPDAGFRRDIEVTRRVREEYPEARLMVDANNGYTPRQTIDYLMAVADCEHEPDIEHVLSLAEAGLIDVLLMDVLSYSLTAWRHLMPCVEALGLGVTASPHAWGQPVKTYYAAHMAAGLGNIALVEGVPGSIHGVDASAYSFTDGVLTVPDLPGSGLELMTGPPSPR